MRLTKADQAKFLRQYLDARMTCSWSHTLPVKCTRCGRKYPDRAKREGRCKARRKPNRWRQHYRHALTIEQYPRERIVFDATYLLRLMRELEREIKRLGLESLDTRAWKYHPKVALHRRLVRRWWTMPAAETSAALYGKHPVFGCGESDGGWMTRGRNKLIKRVLAEKSRVIQDSGCTYTFYPNARMIQGAA